MPNIIQIVADDMGYGDFSFNNFGASCTPTLDQLACEGTLLSQHYSASTVCAPARAGLLTGRYPHRTGAIDTLEGRGLDRIATRERTMADMLARTGYSTGLVGKWHNGAFARRFHPNARGFDEFVGFRGGWMDYWDWNLERNGTPVSRDGRYLTDVLTDEALSFVRRHAKEPFYLHLAYNAPHYPFQAPEADIEFFRVREAFSAGVSTIYAMLRVMDRGIGSLLEELRRLGIENNTIVLFTSDNGPQLDNVGGIDTVRYNAGLSGAKGSVHEGGIKVPMLVRWPDGLSGRQTLHDVVHFTDWLPTLLAAADIPTPKDIVLDGIDVLPLLRGEAAKINPVRFWQWNRYEPIGRYNAAMRDGDWKLVLPALPNAMAISPEDEELDVDLKYHPERYTEPLSTPWPVPQLPAVDPEPELFNLAGDPLELYNLAQRNPEKVSRMRAQLEDWMNEVEQERLTIVDQYT